MNREIGRCQFYRYSFSHRERSLRERGSLYVRTYVRLSISHKSDKLSGSARGPRIMRRFLLNGDSAYSYCSDID